MNSRLLMILEVAVAPPEKVGATPLGARAIVPITGGHFDGPRLRGRVLEAQFETAAPKYAFLNKLLAVGSGELEDGKSTYTFEEIL